MKEKMTLQALKDLFPKERGGKYIPLIATKPGFAHIHNPTYMPPKTKMTPKVWEEQQKQFKKLQAEKHPKKLDYECPICKSPSRKLDYCEADNVWPVLKVV
jgi:hypothetical protein